MLVLILSSPGRNEEFLRNATDYAEAVVISAEVLRNFPEWMKGSVFQCCVCTETKLVLMIYRI